MMNVILEEFVRSYRLVSHRLDQSELTEQPRRLTAGTAWGPETINNGTFAGTTVTVTGAGTTDVVCVGHPGIGTANVMMSGHVQAADTIQVIFYNPQANPITLTRGTLRVDVWRHS